MGRSYRRKCNICGVWSEPVIKKVVNQDGNELTISKYFPRCGHSVDSKQPIVKGQYTPDGYIYVTAAKKWGDGKIRLATIGEHRVVWERVHGELPKGMVVHHINGIKNDNRIENLIAMPKRLHTNYLRLFGKQ